MPWNAGNALQNTDGTSPAKALQLSQEYLAFSETFWIPCTFADLFMEQDFVVCRMNCMKTWKVHVMTKYARRIVQNKWVNLVVTNTLRSYFDLLFVKNVYSPDPFLLNSPEKWLFAFVGRLCPLAALLRWTRDDSMLGAFVVVWSAVSYSLCSSTGSWGQGRYIEGNVVLVWDERNYKTMATHRRLN